MEKEIQIEKSLKELDTIVQKLEGAVTVDEGLKLFEKAITLSENVADVLVAKKGQLTVLKNRLNDLEKKLDFDEFCD